MRVGARTQASIAPLRMIYASFLVVVSELLRAYPTSALDYGWIRNEIGTSGGAGGRHQLTVSY